MLRSTPLQQWHEDHGAKFAEFAGWSMPIQYGSGAIDEHRLVRRSSGLFDVSHMGRFVFSGAAAGPYLNGLVTSRLSNLRPYQSVYGLLCREDGGILDDVFVYRLEKEWLVVVNAANLSKDLKWFQKHITETEVTLRDTSIDTSMIAYQGPRAIEVMDALTDSATSPSRLSRFGAAQVVLAGITCTIGRTGYTGEDGLEIFAAAGDAVELWQAILDKAAALGVECGPVGLAARDSLRFEPGFPLYGHELSEEISPVQARLRWACDLDGGFVGIDAVRSELIDESKTRLATVRLTDRGVPRQGQRVLFESEEIGYVASGMYAPTVDAYCANVFVRTEFSRKGTELEIEIRDRTKKAVVVKRPLYTPVYR